MTITYEFYNVKCRQWRNGETKCAQEAILGTCEGGLEVAHKGLRSNTKTLIWMSIKNIYML